MPEPLSLVYITAPNKEEAISIAHELLAIRLVACANVMDSVTSMYWWQGEIERSHEAVVIAKTRTALADAVIAHVKSIHSYDVPAVMCVPASAANPDFVDWVVAETSKK